LRHSREPDIPPSEHVVIVRALPGLGDLLCAVPAFRALKRGLPEARITLLGLPATHGLARRFGHYLDDFLAFPGFPGIPEAPQDPAGLSAFLAAVRGRFDLAIQMHGSGEQSNAFTALLAARFTAGFHPPDEAPAVPGSFLPWPPHEPEPLRWLKLLAFLGIPPQGAELEFPLERADFEDHASLAAGLAPGTGGYACLHPGASSAARCLPPEQFAAVADLLAAAGLQVVLTGTARESGLAAAVLGQARSTPLDLTGRTSLGALAVLLQRARLLICNDTGVSHLAAALKVPSIVAFRASDPERWAPLDRELHRTAGSFGELLDLVGLQLRRAQRAEAVS
jgi:ADP-heptose:LPS heptosyltransferase